MTTPYIDPDVIGARIKDANLKHTMRSARSQQQAEQRIGASEIGLCRSYMKFMIEQVPYDNQDVPDEKLPAFIGTAVGNLVEEAYIAEHPQAIAQAEFDSILPSGRTIPCHADIIDPEINALVDVKTKDGLDLVLEDGEPSHQYKVQVRIYLNGAIQAGLLKPGARAFLVYIDRSGGDTRVVTYEVTMTMHDLEEIDEWISDAEYAVIHKIDAPKDQQRGFCENYCHFYNTCRGGESFAQGLIEDEEVSTAVKVFLKAKEDTTDVNRRKKTSKKILDEVAAKGGGIVNTDDGPYEISQTFVASTTIETYERAGYSRLNVKKVKVP